MNDVKQFVIQRTINAPRHLVWKAHTEAEHLMHWWGPKGLKMKSAKIDARPGGVFHYGLEAPDGSMMWGKFVYREVTPESRLVFVVSFSDPQANVVKHPMAPDWPLEMVNEVTLEEIDGKTLFTLKGYPFNATDAEADVYFANFNSMNQGFGGTYDQLDAYLKTIQK